MIKTCAEGTFFSKLARKRGNLFLTLLKNDGQRQLLFDASHTIVIQCNVNFDLYLKHITVKLPSGTQLMLIF